MANLVFAAPRRDVPRYGGKHCGYGAFALPGMTAATAEVGDNPHGAMLGLRVPLVTDVAELSPVSSFYNDPNIYGTVDITTGSVGALRLADRGSIGRMATDGVVTLHLARQMDRHLELGGAPQARNYVIALGGRK